MGNGTDTNDIAVRVVACHPEQAAFERTTPLFHGRHGVLTESLVTVLRDLGERDVSWRIVADLVRRRALTVTPMQRPEVEGPAQRVPFSMRVKVLPYALPATADASGAFIDAAPLLGVSVGDTFRLQAPGADDELTTAVVDRFVGDRAVLNLTTTTESRFPAVLDAVPLRLAVPKRAVRLKVADDTQTTLRVLLDASPRLRPAEVNELTLATIAGDGGLVVRDVTGAPLHLGTLPDDSDGQRRAVELVELAATAERFRALASGQGPVCLEAPVVIELASHGARGRTAQPLYGEQLFNGEPISVTMRNGGDKAVYVWLFDIGTANQITLITNDAPSGFRLSPSGSPGDTRTIGGAGGMPLCWPSGIPADGPRVETFVIIIADRPQDLHALETTRARERGPGVSSPLDVILDEVREGSREWSAAQTDVGLRYRVERVEFVLDPRAKPPLDEPAFEVDETPDLTLRLLQPRAATPPPGRIAVRLAELAVRRNGALFGASIIRVDTLIITGDNRGGIVASPKTMHFPNVRTGDVLPLENTLLYLGDVHEFLDLALWVWREDSKGKDLADLFADQIATDDMQGALTTVGGLVLASAAVAPAVGVVAAVAMLLGIGARLVHAATRRDIGVYRTSKLAFERFGVGRTPPQHRKQAQDVEFAYEIVEVE